MKLSLSVVISVKNEKDLILGCLNAIGPDFCDRIIVLDSGSVDGTPQLARDWGAEVIDFEWNGQFPKKRNWFLRSHQPSTTWVLFLDADEFLTDDFKAEAKATLSQTPPPIEVGFWLNYTVYFLGQRLKGGYPLRKLALFRIGAGEYEQINENRWSNLDMEVHEHPILAGRTGVLKSRIDHRDFRSITHYVSKHNEYSSWEASRFVATIEGRKNLKLTCKQRFKYYLMRSPLFGVLYFFGTYLVMLGFRDGARGFAFALMKLSYFTQIYCKLEEKRHDAH